MKNSIYRVYDNKGRYHQSYSCKLNDSYNWAACCADQIKGKIYLDDINETGETISSVLIFPKNDKTQK